MDTRIPGRRFLHSPGPTHVPDEVLDAMRRQPMDMADPRLTRCIAACEAGLQRLLGTASAKPFIYAGNGHGAWEVLVENLIAPGELVLIAGTGHFSDSWALQTEALGRRVQRTPWIEGRAIDVAAVEQALRDDREHQIKALFVVHTDTASGITSELAPLRAALDAAGHPALLVADVVASLGAAPFEMDALGVNVAVGASQKGLMLPPGLGFVAVDQAAMEMAARNPAPRFYWDWRLRDSELPYRKFCGTPPQNLLMGLEAALGLVFQEGLGQVHARHALLARAVHATVEGWATAGALSFFAQVPEQRSVSVTAVQVAPGIDVDALRALARERFQVSIAGGLGPLTGRVFRIGHLGDLNAAMVLGCLAGVEAALTVQGIPFGRDGVARAVACLAKG
ncbi:pyridoxal-phosphate-dependent aminotransferase family protein [Roseateles toxinivorans]|uniref:Alanine-glyoxylate transaminase/serine-glyoxylate transaminase/serine-pyruvate transaminase n=1 Tax=Roseateles toxinivorans TaxID=270368 RepID=A0A4R6QMF9_9BURK|nr:aminotransferase class V-fold PLP-dependent enzyme [Roseateles toxinivorans]TDP64025.1 alanine-glyoxylate transaminase/serine-glyoxylate transaminase/serine-pyruvate transaminase [Roseateles toxinivorans]